MNSELTEIFRQGIAAARAGQRETARELLLRVTEEDEQNVTAWLWLSGVVENVDDRIICLENVLAIDPQNQAARKGLDLLRSQQAAQAAPPAPEPAPATVAAPPCSLDTRHSTFDTRHSTFDTRHSTFDTRHSTLDTRHSTLDTDQGGFEVVQGEVEDEYLCPYCARQTAPEDTKCPACGGQLWQSIPKPRPPASCWLLGLVTLQLGNGLWQLFSMAMTLAMLFERLFRQGRITIEQFIFLYLGLPANVPPEIASYILKMVPRIAMWLWAFSSILPLVIALLLILRWRPAYWFLLGVSLVNLLMAFVRITMEVSMWSLMSLGIAAATVWLMVVIQKDFIGDAQRKRILCVQDKNVSTHSAYYMHGREYARKKMWALAALHFRRAVGQAPGMLAYYPPLAAAYAKLGQADRALAVLREADRIEPGNEQVRELVELIAQERGQA